MRRTLAILAVAAAAVAAPAAAAPPEHGVLVPGRSLGGLRLDATEAAVRAAWGRAYGVCRGCERPTWYFNYFAFRPQGASVEFDRRGRAQALLTLWGPDGWRTPQGLLIDHPPTRITGIYGPLERTDCDGYYALTTRARGAVTAFYVWRDRLWGFGLFRPGVPVCR